LAVRPWASKIHLRTQENHLSFLLKKGVKFSLVADSLARARTVRTVKVPRNEDAFVPKKKLSDYLMSETHSVGKKKARYFRSLGYNRANLDQLEEALIGIAASNEVSEVIRTPFGTKYVIDGDLITPIGITARIRTIWILEEGENKPCLVTAYPVTKNQRGAEGD
jgi:hypothetical protein